MRPSTRKWISFLLFLVVLWTASTRIEPLNEQRKKYHLVLPPMPNDMAPSMLYTPLLALGRAPLVDVLWLRATRMKDEGRIFDALQLSRRICELQPKFAAVWAFQAWNMAYNISVTLKSPEERWRWVRNGYELLRDKGIPLNPHNTQLYRELAWMLFHKVGDFMDDWHWYYKLQFALQMEDILGVPPKGFVKPGRVRGDFYRNYDYQSLADAPLSVDDLLKKPGVKAFVKQLDTFGFDASKPGAFLGLLSSRRRGDIKMPHTPDYEQENRRHALLTFLDNPENKAVQEDIEHYWRAHRLRNEVKLDPKRILELQKTFGVSFDFRLAESHALYWANLGMEMGTDKRAAMDIHKLNTNRIEFYCLQKMFHRGRMAMSRSANLGEPPLLAPDIRVIPVLFKAFINDSKKYLKGEKGGSPISMNFQTGFVGFTRSAILRYHELGKNKEGKKLFEYLKKNFPDPMYDDGYDGFLVKQVKPDRELNDYRVALSRIGALVSKGLVFYAYDEDDKAVHYLATAKQVYKRYQKHIISDRQKIPFAFDLIVRNLVHESGGQLSRASYENLCGKLGIQPLPQAPENATHPSKP